MARWVALNGRKVLGELEASDRYDAERQAAQRWGDGCRRVQSRVSWEIGTEELAAIKRDRIAKFGYPEDVDTA